MVDYYDLVLGLIPLTLLGGTGILLGVGIDVTLAIPGGALIAVGLICHGLFVRSPGPRPQREPATRSVDSFAD